MKTSLTIKNTNTKLMDEIYDTSQRIIFLKVSANKGGLHDSTLESKISRWRLL